MEYMEWWNIGMLIFTIEDHFVNFPKPVISIFHYSSIQIINEANQVQILTMTPLILDNPVKFW